MSAKRWLIVAGWSLAGLAQAGEVRPIIKAGIDTGGDTVVTANFIGGDSERAHPARRDAVLGQLHRHREERRHGRRLQHALLERG
jgi:hypothetical protein